jgi:hypothetical protein
MSFSNCQRLLVAAGLMVCFVGLLLPAVSFMILTIVRGRGQADVPLGVFPAGVVIHLIGQLLCLAAPKITGGRGWLILSLAFTCLGPVAGLASLFAYTERGPQANAGLAMLDALNAVLIGIGLSAAGWAVGLIPFVLFLRRVALAVDEPGDAVQARWVVGILTIWLGFVAVLVASMILGPASPKWLLGTGLIGSMVGGVIALIPYGELLNSLRVAVWTRRHQPHDTMPVGAG